jgi:shikimate 5-dehydrogenase
MKSIKSPLPETWWKTIQELPQSRRKQMVAYDLVYRPLITGFLNRANGLQLRTIDGLDMLVWQALLTWKIWFGNPPTLKTQKKLRMHLLKHMVNSKNESK